MSIGTIAEQGNGKVTDHFSRVVELIRTPTTSKVETTDQGMDAPTRRIDGETPGNDYRSAIIRLVDLYRDIENSSLSLPSFSVWRFCTKFR
jgi:hypothetical protein